MRRGWQAALVLSLVYLSVVAAEKPAPSSRPPQVRSVTFEIHHRVFTGFHERRQVEMKKEFQIGDTPYSAKAVEFVPDFALNLKTHKVLSRSNEPKNPAFRIIVRHKGAAQDTTWAFLDMPPHFAPKSMLAFKVTRIDFVDHAPVVSRDSTASGEKAK